MNPLEFEKIIKPLSREKYHICRTLGFTKDNKPYIADWVIFRKDMPSEEFYSTDNVAVLSAKKGNTIEDIKILIEKEKNNEFI